MTTSEQIAYLTSRVYALETDVEELKELAGIPSDKEPEPIFPVEEEPQIFISLPKEPEVKFCPQQNSNQDSPSIVTLENSAKSTPQESTLMSEINAEHARQQCSPSVSSSEKWKNNHAEKTLGTIIMSVLASILVFASLILFGSYIYKYIPTIGKIAIMALISFIFAVVGLVNMKKKERFKILFSAIAGCGIGSLYITVLVASFLIETMPLTVLLILLAVWTLCVAVLSKFTSKLFSYICYAGVIITTLYFGVLEPNSYISIIYYFVSVVLLFAINYTGSFSSDAFYFIQLPVASLMITFFYKNVLWVLVALIILLAVVMIAKTYLYKISKENLKHILVNDILSFISLIVISIYISYNFKEIDYVYDLMAVLYIIIAIVCCIKYNKTSPALYYTLFFMTAVILPLLDYSDFVKSYIGISVFMLPLIIIGILKDNIAFRDTGYVYYIIYALQMMHFNDVSHLIATIVMLCAFIFVCATTARKYSQIRKLIALFGFALIILDAIEWGYLDHISAFIVFAIISITCNHKWFAINPNSKEQEKFSLDIAYIINATMMVWGCALLLFCHDNIVLFKTIEGSEFISILLVALFTTALFSINTAELFNLSFAKERIGVYICLKFSVLVLIILKRFSAVGYLVSLIGLVLAILYIVIGFSIKHKSFRIFGLILSILCVIKLILFDIDYNYEIMKPVSYLIAGILCFGISWLYSKFEKKEKEALRDSIEK